jgi:AraC-like DNA-binding protein
MVTQMSIMKRALERKRSGYAHKFFQLERFLVLAMETTDFEMLRKYIKTQMTWPTPTRMSKQEAVFNDRSNAIRQIDSAIRIAIKHNMDYETACCLGEIMFSDIHQLNSRVDIFTYCETALELLIKEIQNTQRGNYSVRVEQCKHYIDQHIYEKLTVAGIALHQKINPDYLSRIFKKETKQVLSAYIAERKIHEAKLLLLYTDFSILDIATMLSFDHVSHFSKTFKRYALMTPRGYYAKHHATVDGKTDDN